MDRIWWWIGMGFLILLPTWCCSSFIIDLQHPERWADWRHHPVTYVAVVLILGIVAVPMAMEIIATEWKERHAKRQDHP